MKALLVLFASIVMLGSCRFVDIDEAARFVDIDEAARFVDIDER